MNSQYFVRSTYDIWIAQESKYQYDSFSGRDTVQFGKEA